MTVGMITDQVPFQQDCFYQLRMLGHFFPVNKKSCFYLILWQQPKQHWCWHWVRTVIKRKGYCIFAGCSPTDYGEVETETWKKGATKQSRIKPDRGITDNRTSKNGRNRAMRNDPMPTRSAIENGMFLELIDFVKSNVSFLIFSTPPLCDHWSELGTDT